MSVRTVTFDASGEGRDGQNTIHYWCCPPGVNSLKIECWSGGTAGGGAYNTSRGGYGGAGGTYSVTNDFTCHQGKVYRITVGHGGDNIGIQDEGENSHFIDTNFPYHNFEAPGWSPTFSFICLASNYFDSTRPPPYQTSGYGIGDTSYSGADGTYHGVFELNPWGGNGGGCGGTDQSAYGYVGGQQLGGDGGIGDTTTGKNGSLYGGGGSGGGTDGTNMFYGGAGAPGAVRLTWTDGSNTLNNVVVSRFIPGFK